MAQSVKYAPVTVSRFNFMMPDENLFTIVLESSLKEYFEDVSVKMVKCPNLTEKPFNLAAPGLCGKTSILDFDPQEPSDKNTYFYHMEDILETLYKNKSINYYRTPFIFGNTAGFHPLNDEICELATNVSFSPIIQGKRLSNNKSCIVRLSEKECQTNMLTKGTPYCIRRGAFFLCEGVTGPVIKIHARKYKNCIYLNQIGKAKQFMSIIKEAIEINYRATDNIVGLAGVYTTNNVVWRHGIDQNPQLLVPKKRHTCIIKTPVTRLSILNSGGIVLSPPDNTINVFPNTMTRCFYHHTSAEGSSSAYESDDIEYLGYFTPVETLFRITPDKQNL